MEQEPNILFVTCHDLGQHLGCYDQPTVHSPHLDALAAEGVGFANSFCTAPQCSPSRAALHTGRYPHATGVLGLTHGDFGWDLDEKEMHVAQRLRDAGYTTALVGIQHVTSGPAASLGYDRVVPPQDAPATGHAAVDLLHELSRQDRPFYLEIGFVEPHRPYDRPYLSPDESDGVALPGYIPECDEAREEFAALQGAIRAMDAAVGEILDALAELELEANTWVIFTPDHGLAMPRAKCTLYDPGIETALIMRWPGAGLTGGTVYDELISNVDIVPTMLEALDLPVAEEIQGRSFWSLINDKAASDPLREDYEPRDVVFAEKSFHSIYHPQRSVRTDRHKLIIHFEKQPPVEVPGDVIAGPLYPAMAHDLIHQPRLRVELYDLEADPWEQTSIADDPAMEELVADLKGRLWNWMVNTNDPLSHGPIHSPYYEETIGSLTIGREENL